MGMENVGIGYSPLTGNLYLVKYGKDGAAKDKRELTLSETLGPVALHMLHDMPEAAEIDVFTDKKAFRVTVKAITLDEVKL